MIELNNIQLVLMCDCVLYSFARFPLEVRFGISLEVSLVKERKWMDAWTFEFCCVVSDAGSYSKMSLSEKTDKLKLRQGLLLLCHFYILK